jgi:hypothetical protein
VAHDLAKSPLERIVVAVAAIGAGWAAQKAISLVWTAATGHHPPREDDYVSRFGEVAAAAVVTGAFVGLARVVAARSISGISARARRSPTPRDSSRRDRKLS